MANTTVELPAELQAIDWQALLAKWGPILITLLQTLLAKQPMTTKVACGPDCDDPCVCCDAAVEAQVQALALMLQCKKCI